MGWLKNLFHRRAYYDELAESIREYLEEKIEDLMKAGLSREEATRRAQREFGNATLIEERSREVWQWPGLESAWRDGRSGNYGVTLVLPLRSSLRLHFRLGPTQRSFRL